MLFLELYILLFYRARRSGAAFYPICLYAEEPKSPFNPFAALESAVWVALEPHGG